jgi:hypothetical protein
MTSGRRRNFSRSRKTTTAEREIPPESMVSRAAAEAGAGRKKSPHASAASARTKKRTDGRIAAAGFEVETFTRAFLVKFEFRPFALR